MSYEKGFVRTDRGLFIDKGNYLVDPRHADFGGGADETGAKDSREALALADAYAQTIGGALVLGPGNYLVGANLTLASEVEMYPGAVFTGAGTVTYNLRSGATSAASLVFNVLTYGATGDGVTNDLAGIQAAVDAAVAAGGGVVFFPRGIYRVEGSVTMASGVSFKGAGMDNSVVVEYGTIVTSEGMFYGESSSAATFLEDIHFSDLTLDGRSNVFGFSEYQHLVAVAGVRNLGFDRVRFRGFRGDGLVLHGVAIRTSLMERHNRNVWIGPGCEFDGVDKSNRNAVSIGDCDGFYSHPTATYKRCTSATMPGAIDIEPDPTATFHVVRDIHIEGEFEDIGGNVGVVAIVLPNIAWDVLPRGFYIKPRIRNCPTTRGVVFKHSGAATTARGRHRFVLDCADIEGVTEPWYIDGLHGGRLLNTAAASSVRGGVIGAESKCIDVEVIAGEMTSIGSVAGAGIIVNNISYLLLDGINFYDVGQAAGTAACVYFGPGATDNVTIRRCRARSPSGITTHFVQKDAGHTFTPGTNRFYDNDFGTLINQFEATGNVGQFPVSGLLFPETEVASANPRMLDSYKEGTAVVGLAPAVGSIALNAAYQTVTYTKVGRKVTINGLILVSSVTTPSGALTVTGLPFARAAGDPFIAAGSLYAHNLTNTPPAAVQMRAEGGTTLTLNGFSGGSATDLAPHVQAGTQFTLGIEYFTD